MPLDFKLSRWQNPNHVIDDPVIFNNNVFFKSGSPWVDVKALGAIGDGVTDDTAAITAAISTGRMVFLSAGTYLTSGITAVSNLWLRGAGRGITTLLLKDASAGAVIAGTSKDQITISDLSINGNKAGQTTAAARDGIRLLTCTNVYLQNIYSYDCKEDGFYVSGCDGVNGSGLVAVDNARNGFSAGAAAGVTTNLSIMSLRTSGHTTSGAIGLSLEPAQGARVSDLQSDGDYYGLTVVGTAVDGSNDNSVEAIVLAPTSGTSVVVGGGTALAQRNRVYLSGDKDFLDQGTVAAQNRVITDIIYPDAIGAPSLNVATGSYWSYPTLHGTIAGIDGVLYLHPVYVPRDMTIDRIGAEITAGAVGSTINLLIYRSHPTTGRPQALVLDAGTIDGNSVATQEITISQSLAGGYIYWVGGLVLGGTPTFRCLSNTGQSWSGEQGTLANALGAGSIRPGRTQSGLVAVPNPANTTLAAATVLLVAMRVG